MSEPIDYESLSTAEIMVLRELRRRSDDLNEPPPMPSMKEITDAVENSHLNEGLDIIWDAVGDFVYDEFPEFREPE